jgi:hypothetical protein
MRITNTTRPKTDLTAVLTLGEHVMLRNFYDKLTRLGLIIKLLDKNLILYPDITTAISRKKCLSGKPKRAQTLTNADI